MGCPRHTRVPQGGPRGAANSQTSMEIWSILTPWGAAKYQKTNSKGAVNHKRLKNTVVEK